MKTKFIFLFLIVSLFSLHSLAEEYVGYIQSIGTGEHYNSYCAFDSCAVIMVSDSHKGACGPSSWDFIIRTDTDTGKATLSQALLAFSSQREVVIGGTSKCNLLQGIETLNYMYFRYK